MLMEAKMPFRFDYLNSTHCILRTQQQQQQNSWCLRFYFFVSFSVQLHIVRNMRHNCVWCTHDYAVLVMTAREYTMHTHHAKALCMRLAYRVNFARSGALCWTHPSRMSRCQHFQMNTKNCNFIFIFFISFQSQISKRAIDFVQLHTFHYVERAALWRFTYIYTLRHQVQVQSHTSCNLYSFVSQLNISTNFLIIANIKWKPSIICS